MFQYDFFEVLDGNTLATTLLSTSTSRNRRSAVTNPLVSVNFVHYLLSGTWHFGVYNDGEEVENIEFMASMAGNCTISIFKNPHNECDLNINKLYFIDDLTACPKNCHNNGDCIEGVCKCFPGFQGRDCSQGILYTDSPALSMYHDNVFFSFLPCCMQWAGLICAWFMCLLLWLEGS